jgi:DNA repair exonuclease SbcCD nuclease subunit
MRPVRLLHTSDLHIAGGFSTPSCCDRRDHCLCPLLSVAELAERHRPDALLVVGDLFDHGRVDDDLVADAFAVLAKLPCPTVMINGNHDLYDDAGLYRRFGEVVGDAGVTFLDHLEGTSTAMLDGEVTLWGRAMDDHHPGFRPLQGVPHRPDDGWYVVLGHGHYVGAEPPEKSLRSSPITDDDIAATGADYVALGHWHTLTDVSAGGVCAWYAGSPMMSWSTGVALLVDLVPGRGAEVQPVPVVPPPGGCAGPT